jgi:hypothetical protein
MEFESKTLARQTCESMPVIRFTSSPIEPGSGNKEFENPNIEKDDPAITHLHGDIMVSDEPARYLPVESNQNNCVDRVPPRRISFLKSKPLHIEKSLTDKNDIKWEGITTSPFSKAWDQTCLKSHLVNHRRESYERKLAKSEITATAAKQIPNGQNLKSRHPVGLHQGGSFMKDSIFHTSTPNIYQKTFKPTKKENHRLLKTILKPAQNLFNDKKFSHDSLKLNRRNKKPMDSSVSFNRDELANFQSVKSKIDTGSFQHSYTASLSKYRTAWAEKHEDYMTMLKPRMGKSEDKDSFGRSRHKEFQI